MADEVGTAVGEDVLVVGLGIVGVVVAAQGTNTKTRGKSDTKYPKPEGRGKGGRNNNLSHVFFCFFLKQVLLARVERQTQRHFGAKLDPKHGCKHWVLRICSKPTARVNKECEFFC